MKNKILKIIIFTILVLAVGTVISNAAVVSNDPTVQSGENVTINITSQELVDGYKISISSNSGLTFLSATGGTLQQGQIISGVSVSGMKSLATYNFKAPEVSKDTTYKVTFSVEGIIPHGAEEKTSTTTTSTITVKAKTPTNPGGQTGGNNGGSTGGNNGGSTGTNNGGSSKPTVTEPKFTSASKTVYATGDINLRSSWSTSSSATKVAKGTELRLTGTSTEKVNGYVWYRVTYNGQIKYVARDLITETKPEEKSNNVNLKALAIEGVELTPAFSADVTEYSAKLVNYKETSVKVTAEAEDSKSTVKIEGNEEIKLGENVISVTVTAEDGTTKVYKVTVTNEEKEALGLSSLTIKGIELKDFGPSKFSYEIEFRDLDQLEIEAIANQEGATVEIIGNENLTEIGEHIITIMVTSADGEEIATYTITATKLAVEEAKKEIDIKAIIISAGIAVVILVIIIILVIKYVKGNNASGIDYVYNDNLEENEESQSEIEKNDEVEAEKQENIEEFEEKKKEDKKPTIDDLYADYDDKPARKRGKGRHSK